MSSYWEANSRSASQEIPRNFMEPDGSYSVHKSPLLVRILSHVNPLHVVIPYFANSFWHYFSICLLFFQMNSSLQVFRRKCYMVGINLEDNTLNQRFEGTYHLHLKGIVTPNWGNQAFFPTVSRKWTKTRKPIGYMEKKLAGWRVDRRTGMTSS
jgi:hypothetical protein